MRFFVKYSEYAICTLLNTLIYFIAYMQFYKLTMMYMCLYILILPITIDVILAVIYVKPASKGHSLFIQSSITTICYFIFALCIEKSNGYMDYTESLTENIGEFQVTFNSKLCSVGQLLTTFIFCYSIQYFSIFIKSRIMKVNDKNDNNK